MAVGAQVSSPGMTAHIRLHATPNVDVRLELPPGITVLFGPSGAGKTTVLDCLAGLRSPDEGEISSGGRLLYSSGRRIDVPPQRRHVGYVLQDLGLFPHLTAAQNVEYGLGGSDKSARRQRAMEWLERFRVQHVGDRKANLLSGGEAQRVALARTLARRPEFLLLDEPLTALDLPTKARLMDDLVAWNRENPIPVLYVTHDRSEVYSVAERVLVISAGRIVATGRPDKVFDSPQQLAVAHATGYENILDAVVTAQHANVGTMTCRIDRELSLECPLGPQRNGDRLRVAIRAGDILLARERPNAISARNILPATITRLERRDTLVIARVRTGETELEVHITPGAVQSLDFAAGVSVWLVLKTHSCHALRD